jgi:hypothetical protein
MEIPTLFIIKCANLRAFCHLIAHGSGAGHPSCYARTAERRAGRGPFGGSIRAINAPLFYPHDNWLNYKHIHHRLEDFRKSLRKKWGKVGRFPKKCITFAGEVLKKYKKQ